VEKYRRARQATDDKIIQGVRFACWVSKATDTMRLCNIHCFSTVTMVTEKRLSVTFIVHCLSSFSFCWQ
jgi:hypothetical protein